jgi:hypothetical protein
VVVDVVEMMVLGTLVAMALADVVVLVMLLVVLETLEVVMVMLVVVCQHTHEQRVSVSGNGICTLSCHPKKPMFATAIRRSIVKKEVSSETLSPSFLSHFVQKESFFKATCPTPHLYVHIHVRRSIFLLPVKYAWVRPRTHA